MSEKTDIDVTAVNQRTRRKPGPTTEEGRRRALANILPHRFPKGHHGPGRKPAVGLTIRDWWNAMADWPLSKIAAVLADDAAPFAQVAAARAMKDAASQDRTTSGAPVATGDLDRIIEHTAGKAKQTVDVQMDVTKGDEVQVAMERILGDPDAFAAAEALAGRLEAMDGPALPGDN